MTLSQAIKSIKEGLYALFIYREPEPFSYIRDVDELTSSIYFTFDDDTPSPPEAKR